MEGHLKIKIAVYRSLTLLMLGRSLILKTVHWQGVYYALVHVNTYFIRCSLSITLPTCGTGWSTEDWKDLSLA